MGERYSSLSGSGQRLAAKRILMHFRHSFASFWVHKWWRIFCDLFSIWRPFSQSQLEALCGHYAAVESALNWCALYCQAASGGRGMASPTCEMLQPIYEFTHHMYCVHTGWLYQTICNISAIQCIHCTLIIQPHYRVKQLLWKLQFFTGIFLVTPE